MTSAATQTRPSAPDDLHLYAPVTRSSFVQNTISSPSGHESLDDMADRRGIICREMPEACLRIVAASLERCFCKVDELKHEQASRQ